MEFVCLGKALVWFHEALSKDLGMSVYRVKASANESRLIDQSVLYPIGDYTFNPR